MIPLPKKKYGYQLKAKIKLSELLHIFNRSFTHLNINFKIFRNHKIHWQILKIIVWFFKEHNAVYFEAFRKVISNAT